MIVNVYKAKDGTYRFVNSSKIISEDKYDLYKIPSPPPPPPKKPIVINLRRCNVE